jgi:hypothetical protein
VPNARDITGISPHKFLVLGPTGSGKTTQFLTLPGKKFTYLFDPNARLSLRGHDVDFEEFLPDRINLRVGSLKSKEKGGKADSTTSHSSTMYVEWEKDFDKRMQEGFFEQYDWLGMDSCTTFLDLIMDRILTLNGRYGQWPHQDDWGPQMIAFKNTVRAWTSMGKGIFFTGHLETKQDELTKRIWEKPMMTGRLRDQIPLLFSDIFALETDQDKDGKPLYLMNTVNNRNQQFIRTSMRGLNPKEDVTIEWDKPVDGQGLGGLVNWWSRQANPQ